MKRCTIFFIPLICLKKFYSKSLLVFAVFVFLSIQISLAQGVMHVNGAYCVGSTNTFVFTGSNCSVTWGVGGGSYTIISQNSSTIQVKWNSPTSSSYVYANYSCSGSSGGTYAPSFTIGSSVTPALSIATSQTSICHGTSVTFTASPVNGGTSPYYNWMINGITVSSGINASFTTTSLNNGDVVSAILTSNAACVSTSSATSNSIAMTITQPSPMSVTINGPTTICSGTTNYSFMANVSNGGSSQAYTWYKNGVQVTGVSGSPPYVYAPQTALLNGDKIKCKVTSIGCISGSPAMSNEYTVALTGSIAPSVSIQISKLNYCSGENITFTAVSSYFTSYSTFSWKLNGVQFYASSSASLPISTDGNAPNTFSPGDIVTVDAAGLSGTCLSITTATGTTSGRPITISTPTVPTVSIINDKPSYCTGETITFSVSSSYISQGSTYKWKLDGNQFSTNSAASLQTSLDANASASMLKPGGIVTVEVSGLSGYCISPNTATASMSQSSANIVPFPKAFTLYPNGITTAPHRGLYYWGINGVYDPSLYTFQWRKDGVIMPDLTKGEPRVYLNDLAVYDLVVTQNGCSTPSVNTFKISSINQLPVPYAGEDFTAYLGQPVILDASGSIDPDGNITRYLWGSYYSDNPVKQWISQDLVGEPRFVFTPTAIGTYKFYLDVYDDCNCVKMEWEDRPNEKSPNKDEIVVTVLSLPLNNFNSIKETQVLVKNKLTEAEVNVLQIQNGEKSTTWQYFDGMGRAMQTVQQQASSARNDIIIPNVYDEHGREFRKYLPVVIGEANGYFKINSDIIDNATGNYKGVAQDFYKENSDNKVADDARPFSETTFDNSPLNSPIKNLGEGKDWFDNAKAINIKHPANVHGLNANLDEEKVIVWKLTNKLPQRNTAINSGYYPSGSLLVKSIKDEQQNETREYTDKLGRVVLKKVQVTSTLTSLNDPTQWALTYYIYDDFGSLVYVIQPELSKGLLSSNTLNPSTTDLHNFAFQYTYDERKRMVVKKIPGADSLFMVYDKRNRLVLTQDGNQRDKKEWSFVKYDFLNRPVLTGIYTHTIVLNRKEMIDKISSTNFVESYNGVALTHGYTQVVFPTTSLQVLTVTYYDSYKFRTDIAGTSYDYKSGDLTGQDAYNPNVKGYQTGTKVNILGTSNYLWSAIYYDQKYRILQTKSQNHKGGIDRVTNLYDFVRLIETKSFLTNGGITYSTHRKFEYDHAGRSWRLWHKFHTEPTFVLLQENEYNELGQLVTEKLHSRDNGSTFGQNTDFLYNIRGWLETINSPATPEVSDLFSMELKYNKPSASGGSPMFNGNISEQIWRTTGMDKQSYGYKYDPMNRLLEANYFNQVRPMNNGRYSEKILKGIRATPYDLNGNISALVRYGKRSATTFGVTDDLTYRSYTGNQLTVVDDKENEFGFDDGFKDAIETTSEYVYDLNGNMILDQNKGITSITYNYLNLPVQVNKGTTDYIIYTYDAMGRKLTQKVFGSNPKTTEYLGEYVYENTSGTDVLQFVSHERGRIVPDNIAGAPRPWEYQYFLKDHLGNVRVTFSEKKVSTEYNATLETNSQTNEQNTFKNYSHNGFSLFNHTTGGTYSQLLTAGPNSKIGLAKSMAVNPGDIIDLEVYAKYEGAGTLPADVTSLFSALVATFGLNATGGTGIDGKGAYDAFNSTNLFGGGAYVGRTVPYEDGIAPRTYLNYILFDENFVLKDFGFDQISVSAKQVGATPIVAHDYLNLHVKVQQKGYLYIYLSNEQVLQTNVYFDDLKIVYNSGVSQVNDYYPFGLTYNSYTREESVPNKFLYNGMEKQYDLDLGWYTAFYRTLDPAIGRWTQIDPRIDDYYSWTPYNANFNNPVKFSDPKGDCPEGDPKCKQSYFEGRNESVGKSTPYIQIDRSSKIRTTTVTTTNGLGQPTNEKTTIKMAPDAQGKLSDRTASAVHKISSEAGQAEVVVNSLERSPKDQARVMYYKVRAEGVQSMRDMYGAGGEKVIDAYLDAKVITNLFKFSNSGAITMKIMENTVNAVGPTNVSNHTSDPSIMQVVDIDTDLVKGNVANFKQSINNNLGGVISGRIFPGGSEKAYHIEIPQK